MRHVKLPLRHQSKRLVRVQTEENESRADCDVGHYSIIVRRGRRWRVREERLRLVVVGCAKNRDVARSIRAGCGRRPHDWRATAYIRSRRRCEGCSDRCQRPEDGCDLFDHFCTICAGFLCILTSLYSLYRVAFGSTDGEKFLHGKSATRRCKSSVTHAYRTLALRKAASKAVLRMPSVLQAASARRTARAVSTSRLRRFLS